MKKAVVFVGGNTVSTGVGWDSDGAAGVEGGWDYVGGEIHIGFLG